MRLVQSRRRPRRTVVMNYAADDLGGKFYWRYCAADKYVEEAADFLVDELFLKKSRAKNPYTMAAAYGYFFDRIKAAERGELNPPDEVDTLSRPNPDAGFFEIRWQDINVTELQPVKKHVKVAVRLYYVEPQEFSRAMIGLHGHEKVIKSTPKETRDCQNKEIERALTCYNKGYVDRWGLGL